VDGVMTEEKVVEEGDGKEKKKTSKKVIRKIPPDVIAQAKGLCIFTSMRTGIAPFGGAGGAGLVVAKLSDGSEFAYPMTLTLSVVRTRFDLTQ